MIDTLIISLTSAVCILATLAVANYRIGQLINPPVKKDLEALAAQHKAVMQELAEVRNRINKISIEKGMR